MHGRNKAKYKARQHDPIVAQKAQQLNLLSRELLIRRGTLSPPSSLTEPSESSKQDDETTTLQLIEKLLTVHPDPSHVWNHRREILTKNFRLETELNLTAECLKRNPKAYAAWTHRKYCLRHWLVVVVIPVETNATPGMTTIEEVLEGELNLCAQFLKSDERNFHCWNYRRFVVAAMAFRMIREITTTKTSDDIDLELDGSWSSFLPSTTTTTVMGPQLRFSATRHRPPQPRRLSESSIQSLLTNEWNFTTKMIETNFSNYSAFHYRSKLLPLFVRFPTTDDDDDDENSYARHFEIVRRELELLQNAIFTEPDDQTPWWYFRFVIDWSDPDSCRSGSTNKDNDYNEAVQSYQTLLEEQCEILRELIDETECDGGSKWGLLGLHMLLVKLNQTQEAKDCLRKLMDMDKDRLRRYESMMKSLDI